MESTLLAGRFSAADAGQLLTLLFKAKTDFHTAKIDAATMAEEDIEHTERRILELQSELAKVLDTLKAGDYKHIALHAKLVIEFCPDYHNMVPAPGPAMPAGISLKHVQNN
jgi:hypothetical protein